MPNKVRYYFFDGKPWFGGKAKARLLEHIANTLAKQGAVVANSFNKSKHFKALAHNFQELKKLGVLSKQSHLIIWREREHFRRRHSVYKQTQEQMMEKKPVPMGSFSFAKHVWNSYVLNWAIPLIEDIGGTVHFGENVVGPKKNWFVNTLPAEFGNTLYIKEGKVVLPGLKMQAEPGILIVPQDVAVAEAPQAVKKSIWYGYNLKPKLHP